MLTQRLRANKEILTVDCAQPTVFKIYFTAIESKQVKVCIDADITSTIYRTKDEERFLKQGGLIRVCKQGEEIAIEATTPGLFFCRVIKVSIDHFEIKLVAPKSFRFDFISEEAA